MYVVDAVLVRMAGYGKRSELVYMGDNFGIDEYAGETRNHS